MSIDLVFRVALFTVLGHECVDIFGGSIAQLLSWDMSAAPPPTFTSWRQIYVSI